MNDTADHRLPEPLRKLLPPGLQALCASSPCTRGELLFKQGKKPTMNPVILESVLTCPNCWFARQETMPTDACQFFYECTRCKTLLRPNPGDCCVFCSYGSVKCPPMQLGGCCCPA